MHKNIELIFATNCDCICSHISHPLDDPCIHFSYKSIHIIHTRLLGKLFSEIECECECDFLLALVRPESKCRMAEVEWGMKYSTTFDSYSACILCK